MKNVRSALVRLCFGLVLAAVGGLQVAHAIEWRADKDFFWSAAENKVTAFPGQGSGNVWGSAAKKATPNGPAGTFQKALPFGPSPYANFHAGFTPKNMAKALSPASAMVTLLGMAIIDKALQQTCLSLGGTLNPTAAYWQECSYVSQPVGAWMTNNAVETKNTSKQDSCNLYRALYHSWVPTATAGGQGDNWCRLYYANGAYFNSWAMNTTTMQQQVTVTNTITPQRAEAVLEGKFQEWTQADFSYGRQADADTVKVVDAAFSKNIGIEASTWSTWSDNPQNGQTVDPADSSTVQIKDAPVSKTTNGVDPQGNPTSTTSQDQTTHKYKTDAPVNPVTPTADGKINITHSTTTNNYTTSSTTINSTTNITTSSTVITGGSGSPSDVKTDCDKYPGSIGCASFGAPANADTLTKTEKAVTITSKTFSGGTCPAPVTFTAFARSYTIPYDPLCQRLATVGAIMLALSALLAAWIFADGFRVT